MSDLRFPKVCLNGVQGVLIDIDNTLYPYQPAHEAALSACYELFSASAANDVGFMEFAQAYRQKRNEVTERLAPQGACRSRLFAFQALLEDMGFSQPFRQALMLEELYWQTLINSMILCEDAKRLLEQCKGKAVRVCAVTDMQAHIQIKKLDALGVAHLIDFMVTSEEVGAEKPAKTIFHAALKKLRCEPHEAIMIGDSETKDVAGAQSVGIAAYKVEVSGAEKAGI